jgi:hypothetical protein
MRTIFNACMCLWFEIHFCYFSINVRYFSSAREFYIYAIHESDKELIKIEPRILMLIIQDKIKNLKKNSV